MNDYQEFVCRCASPRYSKELAALGLAGEVGELCDVIKKSTIYPMIPRGRDEIVDEAGDVLWQLVNLLNQYGITLEEVMDHNISKLINRHKGERTAENGGER